MKALSLTVALSIALLSVMGVGKAFAQQYVNGYERSNGTYVQGYYRSQPDGTVLNNYSTRGNVNPYTGQQGTVNPYSNGNTYGSVPTSVRPLWIINDFHPATNGGRFQSNSNGYINLRY